MGVVCTCCKKGNDFPADDRAALRAGARIKVVRNETEDPRAPLLTKKLDGKEQQAFDKDLDDFVQGLSSDDGIIPDEDEIDALLADNNDKQD